MFNVLFQPVPLAGFMMDLQYTLLRSMISKMVEKHELGESATQRWRQRDLYLKHLVSVSIR